MTSFLLGDLNDYITPSQACVKPPVEDRENKDAQDTGKPVVLDLTDCLACSGCITSAETVLVAQQTHRQLYDILVANKAASAQDKKHVVMSISPQSRVAIAARLGLSEEAVWSRLVYFLRQILGVDVVLDTAFARNFCLLEMAREFVERYRQQEALPLLTSACPGWICYAEKKQAQLLPLISTVRSPQQALGALVKSDLLLGTWQLGKEDVFHVSVMPCYDKKLEASRSDFADDSQVRDVDLVITTSELLLIAEEQGHKNLGNVSDAPFEDFSLFKTWISADDRPERFRLLGHPGSGAGGYLEFVLHYAARELFNMISPDGKIAVKTIRGPDYTEYTLQDGDRSLLRFAAVYGFRNIQTFVQRMKSGKVDYHFVEIMACPGACLFGGGQPPVSEDGKSSRAEQERHRKSLESIYEVQLDWPASNAELDQVWHWIDQDPRSRRPLFHTTYRPLPEERVKNLLAVQW